MKAVVLYEAGGPEKLICTDVPTPEPKKGWSLVKVLGFGINHSEIFTRKGLSPSVRFPRILGIECVGRIEQSETFPKGMQIVSIMGEMGRAFDGSYAEYVLLPDTQIFPVDTRLPIEILAAVPETYYTAYGSMCNLKLAQADRVLVRGATSGVGIAFLKLVKAQFPNCRVCATSRSPDKVQRLLDEGFDAVVEDRDNVLQTDERFDKTLELIGPASLRDTFRHTNEGGIVCSTGQLGGIWYLDGFDPIEQLPPNAYLTSFYSGNVSRKRMQEMLDCIARHKVPVKPERVFALDKVPKAHAYLEAHDSFGKVVVVCDP